MRTQRTGGFLTSPRGVAVIIFALLILGLYGMLTGQVGIPMLEWAQDAVPNKIQELVGSIGGGTSDTDSSNGGTDGDDSDGTSGQCGTAGGTEIYMCHDGGECPTGTIHKEEHDSNCNDGEVCCYSPSSP